MVALLEDKLLQVAMKRHYSIADILAVDRQVVNAIMERAARVKVDGSLAIEYVVDSMPGVFMPDGDASRSVADLSSLQSRGDFRSPGGSRVSASDDMSSVSHQQSDAASFKRRLGDMERERNDLRAQLKRGAGGGGGSSVNGGGGHSSSYGGSTKYMGGGNARGPQICAKFNQPNGCTLPRCNFKHVCNKDMGGGRTCNNPKHCALHH